MPNQPRRDVKPRSIKVSDDLWEAAKKRADEKGETISHVVRRALERYAKRS